MKELTTLHDLLQALAEKAQQPAILSLQPEGVDTLTFFGLAEQANNMARRLRGVGLEPGERVVIWGPGSAEWVAACLGAIGAGGIVVPLDVQLGRQALQRILVDCEPRFILTIEQQQERLQELDYDLPPLIFWDRQKGEQSWLSLPLESSGANDLKSDGDSPAVLFYTSGTTGPPKGVPLSHTNLVFQINRIMKMNLIRSDDRLLLPLPLHHVYPFAIGMLVPLALGIPIIFPQALTGPQIIRALQEAGVTVIIGVPRLYRALFEAVSLRFERLGPLGRTLFSSILALGQGVRRMGLNANRPLLAPLHRRIGPQLRLLASGGSPLDPDLAQRLEALGWNIAIGYGLTETSPLLTVNPPNSGRLQTVGKPLAGVDIRLAEVGAGEAGKEIQVRGANVFAGYWRMAEKTEESFTTDGWFRTGDLGHFDDEGYLWISGRFSTLIVTESGENVRPEEVEEAYEASPAIREIGILERKGRLVALIVPEESENGKPVIQKAIAEQEEQMPSHHRLTEFTLTHRSLPRTPLGKIQRHLLAEQYQQAQQGQENRLEKPQELTEMTGADRARLQNLAARKTWEMLADRYPEKGLTPDSHLQQDLGLDSLEWLDVTVEISQRTGVELHEETIARLRTVRDLLQCVAEEESADKKQAVSKEMLADPESALNEDQKRWMEPLPSSLLLVSDLLFSWSRFVMRGIFRLQVVGRGNLPDEGPFVLAPNHLSSLDPLAVAAVLDKQQRHNTYWGGWTGIAFRNPVTRFFSRLFRAFPVDPHRAAASSLAFAALALRRGQILVLFPEGTRSATGELQPFRPGLGLLLRHYPVPVVPIFISGSYEALPPGKLIPRLARLRMVIGKPCEAQQLMEEGEGEKDAERLVHGLRKRVAALEKRKDLGSCDKR